MMSTLTELLRPPEQDVLQGEDLNASTGEFAYLCDSSWMGHHHGFIFSLRQVIKISRAIDLLVAHYITSKKRFSLSSMDVVKDN
jgi:hypothetical protein